MGYVKRVHNNYLSVCVFGGKTCWKELVERRILVCRIRSGLMDGDSMAVGEDNLRLRIM